MPARSTVVDIRLLVDAHAITTVLPVWAIAC